MSHELLSNLDKIHTTELGVERIKKNLDFVEDDVVSWCKEKIISCNKIIRQGKNWYVHGDHFVITINAHSFTIITAHKVKEKKPLSEMSLEELWRLFPIFLAEHQEVWIRWYGEESKIIHEILQEKPITRISHIGSTAVSGIWAKPIIDILIEIPIHANIQEYKEMLIYNGYTCMSESDKRQSFNKGYTEDGFAEKVYHIHLRYQGDNDELYFRDYLNDNSMIAKQYEELKLSLWKEFEHNRDGYTEAKGDFVSKYTMMARKSYGNRYGKQGQIDLTVK